MYMYYIFDKSMSSDFTVTAAAKGIILDGWS